MIEIKDIIGKRIIKAEIKKICDNYDDEPYLDLEFDDKTKIRIIANYGDYTGDSEDEYPRFIEIKQLTTEGEEKE